MGRVTDPEAAAVIPDYQDWDDPDPHPERPTRVVVWTAVLAVVGFQLAVGLVVLIWRAVAG